MAMRPLLPPWTLSRYLARKFLIHTGCVFGALFFMTFLLSLTELLRRTSSKEDVGFGRVLEMAFFSSSGLAEIFIPFACFIGGMSWAFSFSKNREVIAIQTSGIPLWLFLLPSLLLGGVIGLLDVVIYNPVSSILTARFEEMEATHIAKRAGGRFSVSDTGLWLAQNQEGGGGQAILHAARANPQGDALSDVAIFLYDGEENYVGRIDAAKALLEEGRWNLRDAWRRSAKGETASFAESDSYPTTLSPNHVRESFARPKTMSLLALKRFIDLAESTGLSVETHSVYFHSLLSLPFLLPAMVLLGSVFGLFTAHRGRGFALTAFFGLAMSILIYFLIETSHALGQSGEIPVLVSVWTPVFVGWGFGLGFLLLREEG